MRVQRLVRARIREAAADTMHGSVTSFVATCLIVVLVCGIVLTAAGQARLTQERLDAEIAAAASRLVRIRDVDGAAGLDTKAVTSLQNVDALAWVVGFTPTRDVGNAVFGGEVTTTPATGVYGDIQQLYPGAQDQLAPGQNRALAGPRALVTLGIPSGIGGASFDDGSSLSIAGVVHATQDQARLEGTVIYGAAADTTLHSILVMVRPEVDLETIGRALPSLTGVDDPSMLATELNPEVERLGRAVSAEMIRSRRTIILLTLGVGLVLLMIDGFASTSRRRKDIGRRRALGATRSRIMMDCLLERLVVALPAAACASALGVAWMAQGVPTAADARFGLAVAVLGTTCAVGAALPPGLRAAWSDPVRVLRVP